MIIEKDMKLTVHNPKSFAQEAPFWIPAKCQGKIDHSIIPEQNLKKGQGCHTKEDHTQKGQVLEGYAHEGHAQESHVQKGCAKERHAQNGDAHKGHAKEGHAQNGLVHEGYAHLGQTQKGHPQDSHDQKGHAQEIHAQKGLVQEGYANEGHAQESNVQKGHAQEGHTKKGQVLEVYAQKGLVQEGYAHKGHVQKDDVLEAQVQESHDHKGHSQNGLAQKGHAQKDRAIKAHSQESFDEEGLFDLVEEENCPHEVEDTVISNYKICLNILEEIVSKMPIDNESEKGPAQHLPSDPKELQSKVAPKTFGGIFDRLLATSISKPTTLDDQVFNDSDNGEEFPNFQETFDQSEIEETMDSLEETIEEPVESDPIGNSVDSERSFESIEHDSLEVSDQGEKYMNNKKSIDSETSFASMDQDRKSVV